MILGTENAGVGKRIKLAHTRAIVDGISQRRVRQREDAARSRIWLECPGVPSAILQPRDTWADKTAYDATAKKLAGLFIENFRKYQSGAGAQVKAALPVV